MSEWILRQHRKVKKDLQNLEQQNLLHHYVDIKEILRKNPFEQVRNQEPLLPKKDNYHSMRITNQHRVVYHVDKENRTVTIYHAWGHYNKFR